MVVTVSSTLFVCARVLSATGSLGVPGGRSTASCCLFLSLSKNDGIVLFAAFFYFEEEKKETIQLWRWIRNAPSMLGVPYTRSDSARNVLDAPARISCTAGPARPSLPELILLWLFNVFLQQSSVGALGFFWGNGYVLRWADANKTNLRLDSLSSIWKQRNQKRGEMDCWTQSVEQNTESVDIKNWTFIR